MALKIHYQNKKFRLKNSRLIKTWLCNVISEEGYIAGDISFIFTDDVFLKEINLTYLEHDYFTDVITFDMSTAKSVIDGEIYISVDTVKLNSQEYKTGFYTELRRVMVHGILHLCGLNDGDKREKELMRKREDYYLGKIEI